MGALLAPPDLILLIVDLPVANDVMQDLMTSIEPSVLNVLLEVMK